MRNPFRDGVFPELAAAMAPAFGGEARRALEAIIDEYYRRLHAARQAEESGHDAPPSRSLAVSAYDWDSIVAEVARSRGLEDIPPEPIAAMVRRYAFKGGYISFEHPTVPEALAVLRGQGHRLLVVTNGLWAYQEPVLEALGILPLFERAMAPDLSGTAKPDPGAFYAAVGGVRAPEAVHVGDDLLYDVAGARRAGLRAIWVIPPRLSRMADLTWRAPWERPAYLAESETWHAELERALERRPPVDRALVQWAVPDAAVVHVGEVPAVIEHWQTQRPRHAVAINRRSAQRSPNAASDPSGIGPGQRASPTRRLRRWEPPVIPLPLVGEALVRWFASSQRQLPWRQRRDPYAVLVSEFMLQQTQVATVVPYFERFMARFPTVGALAAASLDEVLEVWQGLGYYRRARYLHEAARTVVQRYGGRIPDDPGELRKLPGVGPYMAGAIASIAYGRPEPAIDGNATRVLSRLLLWWEPPGTRTARRLAEWARGMIPAGRAGELTQGLMELGSRICRPTQPLCGQCPVQRFCSAWAYRLYDELPVRRVSAPVPVEMVAVAVVVDGAGQVLLVRREKDGLLGSLWALPAATVRDGEAWEEAARRAVAEQARVTGQVVRELGETAHVFSHRRWQIRAFLMHPVGQTAPLKVETVAAEPRPAYDAGARRGGGRSPGVADLRGPSDVRWVPPEAIAAVPMGRAFRRVLELAGAFEAGAAMRRAAP